MFIFLHNDILLFKHRFQKHTSFSVEFSLHLYVLSSAYPGETVFWTLRYTFLAETSKMMEHTVVLLSTLPKYT